MLCSESPQVDQYTSDDLIPREENHVHIVEMVFRKVVNKLRNLASRNSAVSTSSANKVSTKSVPHQSSSASDDDVQFINQANKRKQPHREDGQTSKQNHPESEEEFQPGDVLSLMFKYNDNKFNNMQRQSRRPIFQKD